MKQAIFFVALLLSFTPALVNAQSVEPELAPADTTINTQSQDEASTEASASEETTAVQKTESEKEIPVTTEDSESGEENAATEDSESSEEDVANEDAESDEEDVASEDAESDEEDVASEDAESSEEDVASEDAESDEEKESFASAGTRYIVEEDVTVRGSFGFGATMGQGDFSDFSGYLATGKMKISPPNLPFKLVGLLQVNALDYNGKNQDVNSVGAGIEYPLTTISEMLTPYLSADLAAVYLHGAYYNSNAFNRLGIGFGLGTELELEDFPVIFDAELKYRMNNLANKEDNEIDIHFIQFSLQFLFPLL